MSVFYHLTVEFDLEITVVYSKPDDTVEFFFLKTNFGRKAKHFVIKKRRQRRHRTAIYGFCFRAVDFPRHRQRYHVLRIYL